MPLFYDTNEFPFFLSLMIRRIDKPYSQIDDTFLSNWYEKPKKYFITRMDNRRTKIMLFLV